MNILLLGYGKMGRIIAEIAESRGHSIVEKIDVNNREKPAGGEKWASPSGPGEASQLGGNSSTIASRACPEGCTVAW